MSVSTIINRKEYAGNSGTVDFSFPYYFLSSSDLVVYLRDDTTLVETLQTITTHYTVTGAGVEAGGTVSFVTAPATGTTVVVFRDPTPTQSAVFVDNDPLPADTLEQIVDKLTLEVQRLRDRLDRSLEMTPAAAALSTNALPPAAAGYYIGWNDAGTALENILEVTPADPETLNCWTNVKYNQGASKNAATLRANTGETNVDAVLRAQGTGAHMADPVGPYPLGNHRGDYATDWQKGRGSVTQVASGAAATIPGGVQNTGSGDYSFAVGIANRASGESSAGIGAQNVASGEGSAAVGTGNTASGVNAMALGCANSASGKYAVAIGHYAYAKHETEFALGGTFFGNPGDSQVGSFTLRKATAATTPVVLTLDGASVGAGNAFTLADNDAYCIVVDIFGTQASGAMGRCQHVVKISRQGATTALASTGGDVETVAVSSDIGAFSVACTADDTLDALTVTVTPANATATRWQAGCHYLKLNF